MPWSLKYQTEVNSWNFSRNCKLKRIIYTILWLRPHSGVHYRSIVELPKTIANNGRNQPTGTPWWSGHLNECTHIYTHEIKYLGYPVQLKPSHFTATIWELGLVINACTLELHSSVLLAPMLILLRVPNQTHAWNRGVMTFTYQDIEHRFHEWIFCISLMAE